MTGKTAIAIDTIINQSRLKYESENYRIFCIYVAVWAEEIDNSATCRNVA